MMLLQFMVGFTDVVVAGQIHPHVQGALGIVTQCQFLFMVFGVALINGGLAAMSQALGANLFLRAERYVGLLFKVAVIFGLFALGLGFAFRHDLMTLLGVPEAIRPLTEQMWVLLLFIMPSSYISFATVAIFRARKNVMAPLFSAAVVCVVNLVADLGFGLGWLGMPNFGAEGIVWASIISVTAGALFNIVVLIKDKFVTLRSFAPWRWEKRAFPYILKVAVPAGGSQVLWQLGYMVLYFITNTLPHDSVSATAGLTAGMRIEALLFLPGMAFSFTGSILVGHCLGAANREEARRVGLRIVGAGVVSMSLAAAALIPFRAQIAAFVAPDPAVAAVASDYLLYNLAATPFTVTSMIMGGLFSGAGATLFSLMAFSIGTWVVRLPLAWHLGHIVWRNASGVFVAMLLSQVVQAAICLWLYLRGDWYRFASTARRFKKG
jgi:MATE family multidrug resistance protein